MVKSFVSKFQIWTKKLASHLNWRSQESDISERGLTQIRHLELERRSDDVTGGCSAIVMSAALVKCRPFTN